MRILEIIAIIIIELMLASLLWAILYGYVPPEPKGKGTVKFFCHFVTNAQAKVVVKKATGPITISHDGSIIQYRYQGIDYILTNSRCQFGQATKNVTITSV